MGRPEMEGAFALTDEFYLAMGKYHVTWAAIDMVIDCAIARSLKVPATDAHLITAGMFYGRKIRLLSDLIQDDAALTQSMKTRLRQSLKALLGSKRDVLTHGYIWSNQSKISFQLRKTGDKFIVQVEDFTIVEFREHMNRFAAAALAFQSCSGLSPRELSDFAKAALSLDRRSAKSPATPADR